MGYEISEHNSKTMKILEFFMLVILISCETAEDNALEGFKDIRGNKIHYKTEGKGQELLFVHGGYLNLDMWDSQVAEFKKEYRTIRFSDIGHGLTQSSDTLIHGYEIIEHLTQSDVENKVTLIGLSWGAMLCVDFALKHPERVEKLILISPGLKGWNYFTDTLAAKNNALRQIAVQNGDVNKAARLFHQNWVIGPRRKSKDLDPAFSTKSLEMITNTMTDHWKEEWSKLDTSDVMNTLDQITAPTYIIIGDQDAEDIKRIADVYITNMTRSHKTVMPNAGHLINMEHTAEFNVLLKSILKEKPAGPFPKPR